MSVRRSAIVFAAVGLVLIVLAALLRFVVVPIATKLPGSTDLTVHYSGTATLLNTAALQSGDVAHLINANVPLTVDRRVRVTATHGDTGVVSDVLTLHVGGQTQVSPHIYALDRTTLNGTTAPAGTAVEPSKGALSSAFPVGAKKKNYRYYDSTTRSIVPARYTGTSTVKGRSVNVYKMTASGPVKDPALLTTLPTGLPKTLVASLGPLLPAALRAQLTPATLAALPDVIPFSYTGTTNIVAYVDQQTGLALDQTISEQVVANAALGGTSTSLAPVSAFSFRVTPASVSYLVDKAQSSGRLLTLLGTVLPLVLLIVGLALIVLAVLRRRRPEDPASGQDAGSTTPQVA
jgi:hypothetical protein